MSDKIETFEWAQDTFAAAVKIREAAEELLTSDAGYAGPAAGLCNQGAERMMYAFNLYHGQDCAGAENTEDLWAICTALRKELKAIDNEAQTLIACEWADYPDFRQRLDSDYARNAIGCIQRLEQALLEIAPELARNKCVLPDIKEDAHSKNQCMDKDMPITNSQELRRRLHQIVDHNIDNLITRIDSDGINRDRSFEPISSSLNTIPSTFKGKKPISVVLPDGSEVMTPTWKKAVSAILRHCNMDAQRHEKLMRLRDCVGGKSRVILTGDSRKLDVPLKIDDDLYMEGKYDTESLLHVLTKRVLEPVGYDYRRITIQYSHPQQQTELASMDGDEKTINKGMEMIMGR